MTQEIKQPRVHPCRYARRGCTRLAIGYDFEGRCENCFARDQARFHGRSQRVQLERTAEEDIGQ